MGTANPTSKDVIQVATSDITQQTSNMWKKSSDVDIKEMEDRDRQNVILGLKIKTGQIITGFEIDGVSMLGYAHDGVSTDFNTELSGSMDPATEQWKGFAIPYDALPEQGANKLRKKFKTTLTLTNLHLVKPNFQIVPIVVAFDAGELHLGHTWVGFSLLTAP
jgi:hypothetical protein